MSHENPPNPFQSARPLPGITVLLAPEDIIARDSSIPEREADEILNRHGFEIAAKMIRAGVDAAVALHRSADGGHHAR